MCIWTANIRNEDISSNKIRESEPHGGVSSCEIEHEQSSI